MKKALWPLLWRARLAYLWLFKPFTLGCRAIVFRGDSVCLVKTTYVRGWMLPGGGVDGRESFAAAAIRETHEETGLEIADVKLLGVYLNTRMGNSDHIAVFTAQTTGDVQTPAQLQTAHEIEDVRFFALSALPSDLLGGHRRRIEEALGSRAVSEKW